MKFVCGKRNVKKIPLTMLWFYTTQHMKLKLHVGRVNFAVVYHVYKTSTFYKPKRVFLFNIRAGAPREMCFRHCKYDLTFL